MDTYQKQFARFFCLALLLATFIFAAVIPPFQAPDEFQHVERQYMLSRGQIMLHSRGTLPSGGRVDNGLLQFMSYFYPMKGISTYKLSQDEAAQASQVRWSRQWTYEAPAGTASYFPALYAPQATSLLIGKKLGLSVSQSYRLARYACLFSCVILLWLAVRVWAPPTIVLALFALPMNLFLISSSVLDGMSLAMFTLAMSLFFRTVHERAQVRSSTMIVLCLAMGSVAACRANMLPMLLLLFVAAWYARGRRHMIAAATTTVLVLSWTVYTITHAVYPPGARHGDNAARLGEFLTHPWTFFAMLYETVTDPSILSFYGYSFIGILGWFDAALPLWSYGPIAAVLLAIVGMTARFRGAYDVAFARNSVIIVTLAAVGLTFLALLVQWTPSGATKIDGVQGRYFMLPAVALCFACMPSPTLRAPAFSKVGDGLSAALLLFCFILTLKTLTTRYHLQLEQPVSPDALSVSPALTKSQPIDIRLPGAQINDPAGLNGISVRLGTYAATHQGEAELQAWTRTGDKVAIRFSLSTLEDNAYKRFELDGKPYVGAQLVSRGGEGISTYEARLGSGDTLTCATLMMASGRVLAPPACPQDTASTEAEGKSRPVARGS